jgi:hypothetical protein
VTFEFARILGSAVMLVLASGLVHADPSEPTLVGTWRLLSMTRLDDSGVPRPYWGDQPDGHVSAQVYDARRPKLGVSWQSATAEAALTAFTGLATYFGTYAVDSDAGTVTYTVQGAMTPDWIGVKLVRSYQFVAPNRVQLRVVEDAQVAATGLVLTWERAP